MFSIFFAHLNLYSFLDLSGTNEGVVKLWHWGSNDALSSYKQVEKSASAKITKLLFNNHGNKFGVSDMDGYLHLYQLLGCSFKSYMVIIFIFS